MITFSDKQLKIPNMAKPVYLVTGGMSKFARAIPEKRTEELCIDALTEAANFIDTTPAKLKKFIPVLAFRVNTHSLVACKFMTQR